MNFALLGFFSLLKKSCNPNAEIVFNASMTSEESLLKNKDLQGLTLMQELNIEQNRFYLIKNHCVLFFLWPKRLKHIRLYLPHTR